MAKRIIPDYYIFNPGTRQVTIPNRVLQQQQLLLIVNEQTNTVIFNFSDPDLYATSYQAGFSSTATSIGTQITLNYNTTAMNTSATLSILVDEIGETFVPAEHLYDGTNKLRTTQPQSLIDTDFEYGLQPVKWENFITTQNYPSYFLRTGGNALAVANISGDNTAPRSNFTVTTTVPHNLTTSDLVQVFYSGNWAANGVFPITTIPTATSLTYVGKAQYNGSAFSSYTIVNGASFFNSNNQTSLIVVATSGITTDLGTSNISGTTGQVITVNTAYKHGLLPGTPILTYSSLTTSANGVWYVYDVPTPTSFRYQTPGYFADSSSAIIDTSNIIVTPRPEASFVHRSTDGGAMITTQQLQNEIGRAHV